MHAPANLTGRTRWCTASFRSHCSYFSPSHFSESLAGSQWFIAMACIFPDLTPCHFWLWGMVKERVCSSKVGDIDDLKATIPVVISTISREMLSFVLLNAIFCVLNMMVNSLKSFNKLFEHFTYIFLINNFSQLTQFLNTLYSSQFLDYPNLISLRLNVPLTTVAVIRIIEFESNQLTFFK